MLKIYSMLVLKRARSLTYLLSFTEAFNQALQVFLERSIIPIPYFCCFFRPVARGVQRVPRHHPPIQKNARNRISEKEKFPGREPPDPPLNPTAL